MSEANSGNATVTSRVWQVWGERAALLGSPSALGLQLRLLEIYLWHLGRFSDVTLSEDIWAFPVFLAIAMVFVLSNKSAANTSFARKSQKSALLSDKLNREAAAPSKQALKASFKEVCEESNPTDSLVLKWSCQ